MRLLLTASAALLLSACGTALGDRMASGAAIGGGVGLVAGGVGAIPGAIIGAGVGAFTQPEQVNLGEPAWKNLDLFNGSDEPQPTQAPTRETEQRGATAPTL